MLIFDVYKTKQKSFHVSRKENVAASQANNRLGYFQVTLVI